MTDKTLSYCESLVKQHDRDRYFIGLCCGPARADLWPLFAFNHEIARTKETVSESTLGLIRLQWWRDALLKINKGEILQHEILMALAPIIKKYDLPFAAFNALLEAREFDLHNKPPQNLSDLEEYAAGTNGPINQLALKVLGQSCDDQSLRDISVAYGLCGIIRAVPFHATQNRSYMPEDLWPESAPRLVAERAGYLLRDTTAPLPVYMRATWSMTRTYLRRLSRLQYKLGDPRLARPPLGFAIKAVCGLI